MNIKRKILFVIADLILISIVGTLIGIFCEDWSNPVRVAIYVLLLLTLIIPGVAAFMMNLAHHHLFLQLFCLPLILLLCQLCLASI